ncbi:MAG TPA: hypothetical protein VIN03_17285 [Roseateles sp.]
MKQLLLLITLCAALACQAAEPIDAAASTDSVTATPAAIKPPEGRCPYPRTNQLNKLLPSSGDFKFSIRFLVKADGSIENVRMVGGSLSQRDAKRAARDLFDDLRRLPAEADQEYVSELARKSLT